MSEEIFIDRNTVASWTNRACRHAISAAQSPKMAVKKTISIEDSGILRIFPRLRLIEKLAPCRCVSLDHLGLKTKIIGIFAKHRELVFALKISRDEEFELILLLDAPAGAKIMCLVDPVKTGPAETDHFLDLFLGGSFLESKKGDEVDHKRNGMR